MNLFADDPKGRTINEESGTKEWLRIVAERLRDEYPDHIVLDLPEYDHGSREIPNGQTAMQAVGALVELVELLENDVDELRAEIRILKEKNNAESD